MALMQFNRHPTKQQLQVFAWGMPLLLTILAASQYWHHARPQIAGCMLLLAVAVGVACGRSPTWRRRLYLGWMALVFPIGYIVSFTLLAVIYYLVITPIGLALRLAGKNHFAMHLDRQASSYWIKCPQPSKIELTSYFRQF